MRLKLGACAEPLFANADGSMGSHMAKGCWKFDLDTDMRVPGRVGDQMATANATIQTALSTKANSATAYRTVRGSPKLLVPAPGSFPNSDRDGDRGHRKGVSHMGGREYG
eukprot:2356544-Rhodomonas_salina.3